MTAPCFTVDDDVEIVLRKGATLQWALDAFNAAIVCPCVLSHLAGKHVTKVIAVYGEVINIIAH
jgi:hypothetical protein